MEFDFEKGIDLNMYEYTYSLNFNSHFKDVAEFAMASWNLSGSLLGFAAENKNLTSNQKVAILMVAKSKRLLRSVYNIVTSGYWPEGEILFRAMFETQAMLAYILQDESGDRAEKWIARKDPKQRWPVSEMVDDEVLYKVYGRLSLYPHGHVLSTSHYLKFNDSDTAELETGPLGGDENNKQARRVLGVAAMTNAGICEIAETQFKLPREYHEKHAEIMKMPYYLSHQEDVEKFIADPKNVEKIKKMIPKRLIHESKLMKFLTKLRLR